MVIPLVKSYGKRSDLNLIFWVRLNRFQTRLMRHLSTIIADFNLTLPQFSVLESLYHKGPMSVGEIREAGLITGGNITVIIANLEKKGLLSSEINPEDKRRKNCALTPQGEALIEEAFQAHLDELDRILSTYPIEDKVRMARLFDQLEIPSLKANE